MKVSYLSRDILAAQRGTWGLRGASSGYCLHPEAARSKSVNKTQDLPNFYITEENCKEIEGPGFWQRQDVPPNRWDQIGGHFADHDDTLAVFTSGCLPNPVESEGQAAVGGVDWMRIERNPSPNEPEINSYHFVVGVATSGRHPVWGPYKRGSFVDHWTTESELDEALRSTDE